MQPAINTTANMVPVYQFTTREHDCYFRLYNDDKTYLWITVNNNSEYQWSIFMVLQQYIAHDQYLNEYYGYLCNVMYALEKKRLCKLQLVDFFFLYPN